MIFVSKLPGPVGGKHKQDRTRQENTDKSAEIIDSFFRRIISSRHGCVCFEPTCVCRGIQFSKHFIEFVVVQTTSGLAKRMRLRSGDFRFKNMFSRKIRRHSPLRSGIILASPEVMHRPRSDYPLPFDIKDISQIRTRK